MMNQRIGHTTVLVENYDDAIRFYTEKLNFNLIDDIKLSKSKRWVLLAPKGNSSSSLLLAEASNDQQKSRIGNQTGGRVFLFLYTDNIERDYQNLKAKKVRIVREPKVEAYGTVAVFSDLYGNLWDLIEPKK